MADANPVDDRVTPGSPRSHRFLLTLSVILLVAAGLLVWPYRAAIVFALLVGYLLHKPFRWLTPRVRWPSLAAGLLLLGVAAAIVLPFFLLTTLLMEDAAALAQRLTQGAPLESRLKSMLENFGVPQSEVDTLIDRATEQAVGFLQGALVPALTTLVDLTIGLIVFFVLLYFILVDGEALVDYVHDVMPLDKERADRLLNAMGDRSRAVLLGSFLIAILQGILAGLGWWLLGLPAPVFWGFVMVVLEIVPVVGAFLVLIPASIWAFTQGNVIAGVGLLVLNFVLVGLVDDVVRPYVIGRQASIHPAIVLIGIVGGLAVFGLSGIILGPILLSLLQPVLEAWAHPREGYLIDGESHAHGGDDG